LQTHSDDKEDEDMNVAELEEILLSMPSSAEVEIFNSAYEWYGIETLGPDQFWLLPDNSKLIINTSVPWDEVEQNAYRKH
jgi:hypothetical protein